jgi:hypothetical protein
MRIDLMCSDYSRASENRRMVKLKLNIEGYLFTESLVRNWPHKKPLPEWLWGKVPSIHKNESRQLYGFHKLDNIV